MCKYEEFKCHNRLSSLTNLGIFEIKSIIECKKVFILKIMNNFQTLALHEMSEVSFEKHVSAWVFNMLEMAFYRFLHYNSAFDMLLGFDIYVAACPALLHVFFFLLSFSFSSNLLHE